MEEKLNLHFASPITGSIFEITSDLVKPFSKYFNLTCEWKREIPSENKRDILLLHFYDEQIVNSKHFDSFKVKILIQPIDGTSIKKKFINGFNKFDLIIVPATASKNILISNGITTDIIIIPNYYKSDLYEKEIITNITKHIPKNRIIFYHESSFHPRKGIELLYEGFVKAFSDTPYANEVVLIVKDQFYNNLTFNKIEKLKRQTIKLQKRYKKPAQILKLSCDLSINELKDLWFSSDIYVSLAKIEGFGIPMLRMFLLNKPIICLENVNSGYHDFLNNSNSYVIPTIQHLAKDEFMELYDEKTSWAIPNISDVISTFRECLHNYKTNQYKSIKNTIVETAFEVSIKNKLQENLVRFSFSEIVKNYITNIEKTFLLKTNKV